jgi:NADH-quinone oxidoreductase subunit E
MTASCRNALFEKYPQEVEKLLSKYPADQKRAAVMPLLFLAQRERGYVTRQSLMDIASILEITPTEVASIVGYYTLYHGEPGGKYRIQVCNDLPCALRGADEFLSKLCENLGIRVGETTPDGLVTLEAVTCLAGCNRAPMFQVQTGDGLSYYENQTVDSTLALVQEWRAAAACTADPDLPTAAAEAAVAAENARNSQAGAPALTETGKPQAEAMATDQTVVADLQVTLIALHGATRQPTEERIHIQELGGQ